jgi:hypothetical protein
MPDNTLRLPVRSAGGRTPPPNRPKVRKHRPVGGLVVLALLGLSAVGVWAWWNGSVGSVPIREHCTATSSGRSTELEPEQAGNAAVIAAVARKRGLPARAASIAIATAIQESKLRNIDYGDRDSLGLFQQRPSQGWGTPEQIRDPVYAANAFYDVLAKVDGYQSMPITKVAQKVQRSAFPDAYADHEPEARLIASALSGYNPAGFTCELRSSGAAVEAVGTGDLTARGKALTRAAKKEAGRGQARPVGTSGTTVRFSVPKSSGDRNAWALAHWAVARSTGLQVTSVEVANRRWERAESTDGWTTRKSSHPNGEVVVTVK